MQASEQLIIDIGTQKPIAASFGQVHSKLSPFHLEFLLT